MSSPVLPEFGDDTRTLQDIDEVGTTDTNITDLVTRSNENASSELESLFFGNVDFSQGVNALPSWFRELAIELQTSYFWVMSNNTEEAKTHREEVREKARMTLKTRFSPAISTS